MKANGKVKGFTLVEMIVVIAIIGVLAGILIPSLIGYVGKAKRKADAATAKQLCNDLCLIIVSDTTEYEYKLGKKATAGYAIHNLKSNTNREFSTIYKGETETYNFHVLCKLAGAKPAKNQTFQNGQYKWTGNDEDKPIRYALEKLYSDKTGMFPIPMQSRSYMGKNTDMWIIGYRNDDPNQIEIWAGYSDAKWNLEPYFRLYPNPSDGY